MDPEDFDDYDDYEDEPSQPVYESKTLTQGAPIIIETLNESMFVGEVIAITQPGIILLQKMSEVRIEDLHSLSDTDYSLSNPIEAFIPFTSIHFIQSTSDISAEAMIEELRSDLDNYHQPASNDSETPSGADSTSETDDSSSGSPTASTRSETRWDAFISILDRILKKIGV